MEFVGIAGCDKKLGLLVILPRRTAVASHSGAYIPKKVAKIIICFAISLKLTTRGFLRSLITNP